MTIKLRNLATLFALALALAAGPAPAQSYPSRTVEFVVHVNPGGGTDVFARLVTEIMARDKLVSQPLVVLNRTGGAGVVAFTYAKSKRGDPHTVLTIATGSFLTAAARSDLDLGLEHFTPIAFFARDPQGIMVAADSKYKTIKDLLDDAKPQPDTIVCAVTSATGTGRMTLWKLEKETGARFKFVTFKAGSEAVVAVLGGHVPFTTENVSGLYRVRVPPYAAPVNPTRPKRRLADNPTWSWSTSFLAFRETDSGSAMLGIVSSWIAVSAPGFSASGMSSARPTSASSVPATVVARRPKPFVSFCLE